MFLLMLEGHQDRVRPCRRCCLPRCHGPALYMRKVKCSIHHFYISYNFNSGSQLGEKNIFTLTPEGHWSTHRKCIQTQEQQWLIGMVAQQQGHLRFNITPLSCVLLSPFSNYLLLWKKANFLVSLLKGQSVSSATRKCPQRCQLLSCIHISRANAYLYSLSIEVTITLILCHPGFIYDLC